MKSRILATAAVAIALAIGVAAPAFATSSYTGGLSQNSSAPGGTVQYTAEQTGQTEGSPATYDLNGPTTATAATGSLIEHTATISKNGRLSFSVKIPNDAKPGSTFKLLVNSGTFSDSQKIFIVGPLAVTGGSAFNVIGLVIGLAIVLVLALIIALIVVRRRNAANRTA